MPTYPVINQKTGEKKELSMTMIEYSSWRDENPEWDKDWNEGCAGLGEVGEWRDKLITRNPGWNDVLHKASKSPGSRVSKINKQMAKKNNSPIGVGMTAKQMKRRKPINSDLLNKIDPITENQKKFFERCHFI